MLTCLWIAIATCVQQLLVRVLKLVVVVWLILISVHLVLSWQVVKRTLLELIALIRLHVHHPIVIMLLIHQLILVNISILKVLIIAHLSNLSQHVLVIQHKHLLLVHGKVSLVILIHISQHMVLNPTCHIVKLIETVSKINRVNV